MDLWAQLENKMERIDEDDHKEGDINGMMYVPHSSTLQLTLTLLLPGLPLLLAKL